MSHVAYKRVSTTDQNTDRQLTDTGITFDKEFTDKATGKNTDRPALAAMLEYVREGDTIHVHSIDRLARSLVDLNKMIIELKKAGVNVRFHKEGLSFSTDNTSAMDELLFNILGSFAQFEVSMIRERQREGIEVAKAAGKYKGKQVDLELHNKVEIAVGEGLSLRKVAAKVGCSVGTVQKVKQLLEGVE